MKEHMAVARSNCNVDESDHCSYCGQVLGTGSDYLLCVECKKFVHAKCLRNTTPGDMCGDVFFDLTCINCMQKKLDDCASSSTAANTNIVREKFERQKLSWITIITLTLYNLSVNSKGHSRHGYFHWRMHIVNFINKNWDHLFSPNTRRGKNWIGSVSGNMSHNSPQFFLSGLKEFNETGWWKLAHSNMTPRLIQNIYKESTRTRRTTRHVKRFRQEENITVGDDIPSPSVEAKRLCRFVAKESCSRLIPYMGCTPKPIAHSKTGWLDSPFDHFNATNFNEFIAETVNCDPDYNLDSMLIDITDDDTNDLLSLLDAGIVITNSPSIIVDRPFDSEGADDSNECIQQQLAENESESIQSDETTNNSEEEKYKPRIVQITNYRDLRATETLALNKSFEYDFNKSIEQNHRSKNYLDQSVMNDEIVSNSLHSDKKLLFPKQSRRPNSGLKQEQAKPEIQHVEDNLETLTLMSAYEERKLLAQLHNVFNMEDICRINIPTYVRRFYRKLCIRDWKRKREKKQFNIFDYVEGGEIFANQNGTAFNNSIIDRFHLLAQSTVTSGGNYSFKAQITGSSLYELFQSPSTKRILQPFIYRNTSIFPHHLKLTSEIQQNAHAIDLPRAPIDFCYVRPYHIPAVNALLQKLFWPGIDMSECLNYPDFSIVALYKKLVVGCGFLVPDVRDNEAYISFMAVRPGWQRNGIGTFMLFHLTQSCLSRDITLHVSISNPAVVLYQKCGFKIEEVIINFYDKYLPLDSPHSPNAYFLRLKK